mgnify:FL=1
MYLVFDIGGTAIKYCWMSEAGEIFNKQEILSTAVDSLDKFIETVAKIYHESNRKVEGIALSCPGVIDAANGTIKVVVAYPYLQGICLTELISKACDNIKVSLENDAKCAGLAEAWIGSAQAYDDAIIVVLGTGIGGAIIKNKQIHHGAHLFAGEISTLIVDYDKETNQVLTWSDIASTTALCKRAAEALAVTSIDGRRVFELANNADEVVLEVLKNFCLDIAIQLYNLQYSYDPGVICIGGGISKQPLLIKLIKEAVEIIANETNQLLKPNVTTCKFYNEANLIGALSYFLSIK